MVGLSFWADAALHGYVEEISSQPLLDDELKPILARVCEHPDASPRGSVVARKFRLTLRDELIVRKRSGWGKRGQERLGPLMHIVRHDLPM